MYRVLLVSDHPDRTRDWTACLRRSGLHVIHSNGEEGSLLPLLTERPPEVVLFDAAALNVPLSNVRPLLRHSRTVEEGAVIAATDATNLTTLRAEVCPDDFLVLPAEPDEVVARVRLALWRRGHSDSQQVMRFGELLVDLERFEVRVAGRQVDLAFREFQLLRFLAENPGRAWSRDGLLMRVWGYDYFGGTRTVDVHVRRLRAKLGAPCDGWIETVHQIGYRFRPDNEAEKS